MASPKAAKACAVAARHRVRADSGQRRTAFRRFHWPYAFGPQGFDLCEAGGRFSVCRLSRRLSRPSANLVHRIQEIGERLLAGNGVRRARSERRERSVDGLVYDMPVGGGARL
jgi:hypothetical protein